MQKTPLTADERLAIQKVERLAQEGTYYALLGLDRSATRDDVEQAYREYVREWHPDRFYSRDTEELMAVVEENFVNITRAYKTLREPNKRAVYDSDLAQKGVEVAAVAPRVEPPSAPGFEVKIDRGATGPRIAATDGVPRPAPAAPPAPQRPAPPSAMSKIKAQIAEQLSRAASYYATGLEDFQAGRFAKAEGALYLATRYDPRNVAYADLFHKAQAKARQARGATFLVLAQQAEQYQNVKDAIANYRKAIECDPEVGVAFARLAHLVKVHEDDAREAINLMRRAVGREAENPDFRVQLAEMYAEQKMEANALRELQVALEIDPRHAAARAAQKRIRGR